MPVINFIYKLKLLIFRCSALSAIYLGHQLSYLLAYTHFISKIKNTKLFKDIKIRCGTFSWLNLSHSVTLSSSFNHSTTISLFLSL